MTERRQDGFELMDGQVAATCVSVSLLFGASAEEVRAGFTTVWMHGAHDRSTVQAVSAAIRRASDIDDADVMVDFSDVSSIDIAAVQAILSSRLSLQRRSLLLCARRPSSCVRRLAETNGFGWFFAQGPGSLADATVE